MEMRPQEEDFWCWAAVGSAIHNALNGGATDWTQGELATEALQYEHQIDAGVDCSTNPELCDIPAGLHDALHVTGNLKDDTFLADKNLDFDSIVEWVDIQLPVGARICWWGG